MFAKSPKGATASGICYSIVETLPNIDLDNHEALDACLSWSEILPEELKRKIEKTENE